MRKPGKQKALGTFEIARRCHVTPTTVFRWIKRGKLRAFRTAGGRNRVMESDLSAFLRALDIPDQTEKKTPMTARVLIVDDDPPIRRLMRRLIENNYPKAEIHEASDGYEAGYKTRDLRPTLVILDLMLPSIDGIKVCRIIRKDKNLEGTKIFAITGYRVEKSKRVILRAGANDFLSKPFSNEEFVLKINQLL